MLPIVSGFHFNSSIDRKAEKPQGLSAFRFYTSSLFSSFLPFPQSPVIRLIPLNLAISYPVAVLCGQLNMLYLWHQVLPI